MHGEIQCRDDVSVKTLPDTDLVAAQTRLQVRNTTPVPFLFRAWQFDGRELDFNTVISDP